MKYTHDGTALDKRSYNADTLSNKLDLKAIKDHINPDISTDSFFADFTKITKLFIEEVLSKDKYWDICDINNCYSVLGVILKFISEKHKLGNFTSEQELIIQNAYSILHNKFDKSTSQPHLSNSIATHAPSQPLQQRQTSQVTSTATLTDSARLKLLEESQSAMTKMMKNFMASVNSSMNQLKESLIPFNNRCIVNNNNHNNNNNNNNHIFENSDSIKATNLIDKKLRFANHLKNASLLTDNKKVFMHISNKKMPRPFFSTDSDFVYKYNKLVNKFQDETIELIKQSASQTISSLDSKIKEIKSKHHNDPLIEDKLQQVLDKCNNTLLPGLLISNAKVQSSLDSSTLQVLWYHQKIQR